MSRFKGTKGMLILIVLVCAVIGYYFYIANKGEDSATKEERVEITAVKNVLLRNLERDYPPTPKEVVKYFAEITRCFYSEKYTDEEFNDFIFELVSLLENNVCDI